MYTASTQPGSSGGYHPYDYHPGYPGNISRSHSYGRPSLDPPRPLEPRPSLHTSLSESAGSSRHHMNVSHGPLSPDHRPQGQNLPALRDILPPGSHQSERSPYGGGWNRDSNVTSSHTRSESHYRQSGLHPPMALYPSSDHGARYQPTPQTRSFEVPVLQTSPVATYPPHTPGAPHYSSGYPEPRRDYPKTHSEQPVNESRGIYSQNIGSSSYSSATPEDSQYRTPFSTHDQVPGLPYTPSGSDNRASYLGVTDVPGEGSFYLYDNGHRIPTQIDGEQVNPQWGLTKANKPRKRLALACLDCREKKIKCEPGVSSCLQCEKAKRPCRRAQAQTSQPDTSTTSWPSAAGSPVRNRPSTSDPTPTQNRDTEPDPLNKRRTRENSSPPHVPTKKHRSTSFARDSQDARAFSRDGMLVARVESPKAPPSESHRPQQRDISYSWEIDPYNVNPEATLFLANLYFAHVNNATYCMYPRGHFLNWLRNYRNDKCQNELMVLYAMLAAATIFDHDHSAIGKQFADIARNAIVSQAGKFNLATTQTHIMLSLYHFAKGTNDLAFFHHGAALHSVEHLRYNTERGCLDDSSSMVNPRIEFACSREQLAECKRRTFWTAVYMDRTSGTNTCEIKPEDMFVRLPCTDDMYERSISSDAPYSSNGIIDPSESIITASSPVAPMAWLMMVAILWGNVVDFIFRARYRASASYGDAYKQFYDDTNRGLQGWRTRIPAHLQYSEQNLDISIQQGYAGTFTSMHALYHLAQIRLNRYMRHALMAADVPRNIRAANTNAHELLRQMSAIQSARRAIASPAEGQPTSFSISTPFLGYATLAAIDITSAGGWEGKITLTVDEINAGIYCLSELSTYWVSAEEQLKVCRRRPLQIRNLWDRDPSQREGAWYDRVWGLERPMEQEFEKEYDSVYGLGDSDEAYQMYFGTLKPDESDVRAQPGSLRIA